MCIRDRPWLRSLGLTDVYMAYIAGYTKIGDLQAIGGSLRYFSIGNIDFTDENGTPAGTGRPNELELTGAYSRKLSDYLDVYKRQDLYLYPHKNVDYRSWYPLPNPNRTDWFYLVSAPGSV